MTEHRITRNEWEIVTEMSSAIRKCSTADDMCRLAGQKIHSLNPKSYVVVSLFDPESGGIRIRSYYGFGRLLQAILKTAPADPRQLVFHAEDMTEEEKRSYTCGRLIQLPGGFHQLAAGKYSPKISRIMEKILNVEEVLTIGFGFEGEPYGGVIIFRQKHEEIKHIPLIESLVNLTKSEVYRRQAEQSNMKLRAMVRELEAFTYSVSHDLRAPLRAVKGFTRALMEDFPERLAGEPIEYLRKISASSEKMSSLINNLLKLSRISQSNLKLDEVNLTELAHEIEKDLHHQYPGHNVKLTVDQDMAVRGDPHLLRIVLTNLMENAWKYTVNSNPAEIGVGKTQKQGKPVYYVRDNGLGFNMDYADKLFQPFQRLHNSLEFAGNGIGLTTVDRIVRRHGGTVWAESHPGEGAVFYFSLE